MGVIVENDAFGRHLLDAPVDMALLKLEVGNPVAQQAARLGVLLVDMDVMAGAGELLGASESRRPDPTTAIFLPVLGRRARA